jgi:hypothetical protein
MNKFDAVRQILPTLLILFELMTHNVLYMHKKGDSKKI